MLKILKGLFTQGYQFIEESYYGSYSSHKVDDFSEVEKAIAEADDDEGLYFEYEISYACQTVYFGLKNEE